MKSKRRFLLRHKYGFTEKEISIYSKLNQSSDVKIENLYISQKRYTELRKYLDYGSWKNIIHNKWISSIHFSQNDVAQPKSYGLLHPLYGIDVQKKPLLNAIQLEELVCEFDLKKFVLKHIGGGLGDSVYIVKKIEKHDSGNVYVTIDQKRLGRIEINDMLSQKAGNLEGYKIEEFLDSHESINRITDGGASSLRIYTLREKPNSTKAKIGYIRFGLPNKATDHLSNGAILASIEMKSGKILKGIAHNNRTSWVKTHSITDEEFTGIQIPFWDSVVNLVEQAAHSCPGLNWVGWDVVLSDSGPYLIEGNVGNTMLILQQLFGGFIDNAILDEWIKHLNIPITEGKDRGEMDSWKKRYVKTNLRRVIRR